jgi:hypothetical protein
MSQFGGRPVVELVLRRGFGGMIFVPDLSFDIQRLS